MEGPRRSVEQGDPQPPKDAVASPHVVPPPPYVEGIQDEPTTIQLQTPKDIEDEPTTSQLHQQEGNNVCDQCDPSEIIPQESGLVLLSCCCCWVCYLVFLILGAVMISLWTNNDFAFNALGESYPITAVETWSVKPGDGASLWRFGSPGWWCNHYKRADQNFCGVELEVFLSQMNNHTGGNTINQTYCKSCESYTNNVYFWGSGIPRWPPRPSFVGNLQPGWKAIVEIGDLDLQKKLCRDFYRYTVKTPEGNDVTTVACSCRPAGTTVEQCTRKSPSQTPVSEVGSLVEIWRPRTTPVSDYTAVYFECGDAQCYQTEDPMSKYRGMISTVLTCKHYTNVAAVVLSVLFVLLCLAHIAWRKLQRSLRPAPSSAICAICGRQNPRYLRHGLLREYMMTSYTVGSGH